MGFIGLLHLTLYGLLNFQLLMEESQIQRGMELKGTTRGEKRSQEVVNPGSLTVKEKKHQMAPQLKRYEGLFCFCFVLFF